MSDASKPPPPFGCPRAAMPSCLFNGVGRSLGLNSQGSNGIQQPPFDVLTSRSWRSRSEDRPLANHLSSYKDRAIVLHSRAGHTQTTQEPRLPGLRQPYGGLAYPGRSDPVYRPVAGLIRMTYNVSDLNEIHRIIAEHHHDCEKDNKKTTDNPHVAFLTTKNTDNANKPRGSEPFCWQCGGPHLKSTSRERGRMEAVQGPLCLDWSNLSSSKTSPSTSATREDRKRHRRQDRPRPTPITAPTWPSRPF
eukprot:scaffold3766_cov28-Prasinocladus_malaysianus.AAC.3